MMKTITWIQNVCTGRIGHWVNTHNVVVDELWQSTNKLPAIHGQVLRSFCIAVDVVLEPLLLTERKQWRTTQTDLNKIGVEQFRRLYAIFLTYFIFLLCLYRESFRPIAHDLHHAVESATGEAGITRKIFAIINRERVKKNLNRGMDAGSTNPTAPWDFELKALESIQGGPSAFFFSVEFEIWNEITEIIGLGSQTNLGQEVAFSLVVNGAFLATVREIDGKIAM